MLSRVQQTLGIRPRKARRRANTDVLIRYSREELDMMYDSDTVDVKQFGRMEPGPAKDEMRTILEEQRKWYNKAGLIDWAEQIDVALWLDEKDNK